MIPAGARQAFAEWLAGVRAPCVFIIGTGRSGTHLLAEILSGVPSVHVLIEKQPLFRWSSSMAMDHRLEPSLFPRWVRRFRLEQFSAAPRTVIDKCHTNMWLVERLVESFPTAVFLATRRGPHATIASMLRHGGFVFAPHRWRSLPLPNRFLGIAADAAEEYATLSQPEQLALRWISNERRRDVVRRMLGDRLLEVEYELLMREPAGTIRTVCEFLHIDRSPATPAIKPDTLAKWRHQLHADEVAAVDAMLRRHGFAADASGRAPA